MAQNLVTPAAAAFEFAGAVGPAGAATAAGTLGTSRSRLTHRSISSGMGHHRYQPSYLLTQQPGEYYTASGCPFGLSARAPFRPPGAPSVESAGNRARPSGPEGPPW